MPVPSPVIKSTNLSVHEHYQTEELVADSRTILTPSQRVDQKLAACTGRAPSGSNSTTRTFSLRRAK